MNKIGLLVTLFAALPSLTQAAPAAGAPAAKPNVLLILADDVGFSDLGCYGGEIATPNLDALAADGLQVMRFYNAARCSPTRAALLSGLNPQQVGFSNLNGNLTPDCAFIPEVLKPIGYHSTMVGKWHLGRTPVPTDRGFEEFYGMLGGFNSCWRENPFYTRWPQGREKRAYAPGKFYSTDVFGDYSRDFIGDGSSHTPWFQYLAFNAAHFPLGAPETEIEKYEKMYFEKGWDRIRDERMARQKKLGLFAPNTELPPRSIVPANKFNKQTGWADKQNPEWNSLPEDRRRDLARRMAVYAAMVEHMDRVIGEDIAFLKKTGQYDNTVIFFLSDNGACAEWDPYGFDRKSGANNILHTGADLQSVGGPESYVSYGSGWANACNTPFRFYKHYAHEGGIRTPFIVHWPAGLKARGRAEGPGYITDLMPTICELTGATYPTERDGNPVPPEAGISLVPLLKAQPLPARRIVVSHEGSRCVIDGNWKLVSLDMGPWELYNISSDPTEMHDLASRQADQVRTLTGEWDEWLNKNSKPAGGGRRGRQGRGERGATTESDE